MQHPDAPLRHPSYTPPPPPSHNGGLYTGEPFLPGAPWANVPVVPDAGYMVHVNLRSARPMCEALHMYPAGNHRPGNNYTPMPGVGPAPAPLSDLLCMNACGTTERRNDDKTPATRERLMVVSPFSSSSR